jgi:ferritin-like metal-binding protein YciE
MSGQPQLKNAPPTSYSMNGGMYANVILESRKMGLENVLVEELRDLYSAETQLVKALPKMAKGTSSSELKELFNEHLEQTKGHVDRLKQAFEHLGEKPTGETCRAMEGLVKEGQEQLDSDEEGAAKDVCISGAALRVEHYEIAGYTAAIAIATAMGQDEIVALLTETLHEEEEAGEKVLEQSRSLIEEASSLENEEMDEDEPTSRSASTNSTKVAARRATR